ncbi:Gfo/Idh/MocA family protein [Nocardioides okcheonensis]|uniref:Gfo/Idh/MocA family protein n=1 Tax=Nocardioides okcheonensis TaxID=2894081 RepID=UPI001E484AA7|nr:Gfo/Idh/MocA family oxidoreductase [Nocardioides okcheonensis]
MGRNHARVIATGPRTELAAVIDPHEESGLAVAEQYGSAWQPDLDGVGGFDAVVVAAATEAHHDIAAEVIAAGRPLLVEKPLCPSLEQSEDLVRASEAAGTPLMCGFLERFNPAVMTAMKMIEAPVYVRAQRHSPYAPRIKTGVAWDLLVHDVDLVVRAFGEQQPESFDVSVGQFHPSSVPGAEDVVEAGVRFTGGGIASVSASRLGQVKVRSMVIQELDRMIEIDLLRRGLTSYRHSSIEPDDAFVGFRQFTEIEVPEIGGAEPLVSQLAHFVDLVDGTVDADTERASILPAHRVVDEVLRTR